METCYALLTLCVDKLGDGRTDGQTRGQRQHPKAKTGLGLKMTSTMMTSSNRNIFCITGHRWIALIKASDAELWFLRWFAPEDSVEQTIGMPVIWDAIALIMMSPMISCMRHQDMDRSSEMEPYVFCSQTGETLWCSSDPTSVAYSIEYLYTILWNIKSW